MNPVRSFTRPVFMAVATLAAVIALSLVNRTKAAGVIDKAELAGDWIITLTGDTGCGISTSQVTVHLKSDGVGTATIRSHTSGCGDPVSTGESFTIMTLNSDGTGTAGLSCGSGGCGWIFQIQVAPGRSTFNLVDITDPNNFLEGVAVRQ